MILICQAMKRQGKNASILLGYLLLGYLLCGLLIITFRAEAQAGEEIIVPTPAVEPSLSLL
jgi:hypothetical protein